MKLMRNPVLLICVLFGFAAVAQARDRVSIGVGLYSGPGWGYSPRCYGPPPVVYTAPVYVVPPPPPVYYGRPVAVAREDVYAAAPVSVEVVRVQDALRARRYYRGIVDGVNGPATKAAVRSYQIDRGLPVTGRIDGLLISDLGL